MAVIDIVLQHLLEIEHFGAAFDDGQHHYPVRGLQHAVTVELVEYDFGLGIPLNLKNNAQSRATRFIADIGESVDRLVPNQFGYFFQQIGLVYQEGYFADHNDLATILECFNIRPGPDINQSSPCPISLLNPTHAINDPSGGKIGGFDILHKFGDRNLGIINQCLEPTGDFAQIVRRNLGGHTDGNTH